MPSRKNLVIVHAHDMGRYNSAYGHPMPTPRMAQFAEGALSLQNAHCAAPTCSPSRAAMLTGETAHQAGMFGLTHRGWKLKDTDRHLAAWLGRHGYQTVLAGVQHEIHGTENTMPYETVLPCRNHGPWTRDINALDAASHWLEGYAGAEEREPFFLWLGLFLPHVPFIPADPGRFPADAQPVPGPIPDCREARQDMADYMQSVERTDQCFGILLDVLRQHGLDENTVVVLTTDHGIPFPNMKCNLTAHGTGVTLIMRDPEHPVPASPTSDALVSHLDLFPTLCDALAVPPPDWLLGQSFMPLFGKPDAVIRTECFAEINYHAAYHPSRALRTGRYNYIVYFDADLRRPLTNCDGLRCKDYLVQNGWANVPLQRCELYDLSDDPDEAHNRAGDPEYAEVEAMLRTRLHDWMVNTGDPLLDGPIPLPPGARCNTRDSISSVEGPFVKTSAS